VYVDIENDEPGQGRAEHRTARRGAFPGRRVIALPPLRAQLHTA
jgi:hypothetical protein